MNKLAIILHSPLAENAPADELDVLDQAAFAREGLLELGYQVQVMACPYDMAMLGRLLNDRQPACVVNLVETLFSNGRLVHVVPFLLEHFGVPYTGCPADALYTTSNKILAKKMMVARGIPTPAFYTWDDLHHVSQWNASAFLIKSLWEHASFGIDENHQLLFSQREELIQQMQARGAAGDFFAEEYIHGREFNISVLDSPRGPQVLPVAEIRFSYPEGKPRIVGYRAKWDEASFEYANTTRSFEFPVADQPLISRLKQITLQCWRAFDLKGYARVDFRVDDQQNIFVLEINANPCISADAGFVAAAAQAGLSRAQVMARIVGENNE
ncbi:MAG: hypothetical protein R6U64_08670 [Bacteroidales bacterium]